MSEAIHTITAIHFMAQTGMKPVSKIFSQPRVALPIAAASLWLVMGLTCASNANTGPSPLGNDDTEFVFAGTCPNGEKYRIFAYTQIFEGQAASFYDYEGPAGTGKVRSNTSPRTLAVRVCRKLAEIIDDH